MLEVAHLDRRRGGSSSAPGFSVTRSTKLLSEFEHLVASAMLPEPVTF